MVAVAYLFNSGKKRRCFLTKHLPVKHTEESQAFTKHQPDTAPDIIMYALHLTTTLGLSSVLGSAVTVCLTSRLFCGQRTVPV